MRLDHACLAIYVWECVWKCSYRSVLVHLTCGCLYIRMQWTVIPVTCGDIMKLVLFQSYQGWDWARLHQQSKCKASRVSVPARGQVRTHYPQSVKRPSILIALFSDLFPQSEGFGGQCVFSMITWTRRGRPGNESILYKCVCLWYNLLQMWGTHRTTRSSLSS